jgi:hypothetical protein
VNFDEDLSLKSYFFSERNCEKKTWQFSPQFVSDFFEKKEEEEKEIFILITTSIF